ncbi:MAG: hypothetical protein ACTSSF_00050 [Candidatus Heimdallarchaeaceae archaeon]
MTWKEFKEKVDKELKELEINEDTNICWIDVTFYISTEVKIRYDRGGKCLIIEN